MCTSPADPFFKQVKQADIVVSAIGKAQYVQGDWIKPGAVLIDVGTNYIPGQFSSAIPVHACILIKFTDATKKSGQRLVGDVNYESALPVASHITPVPDRKSTRLNSSHSGESRMPSSA